MSNETALKSEAVDGSELAPVFANELIEMLAVGRESLKVKREARQREKEERERQQEIRFNTAWENFEGQAREILPPALRPYIQFERPDAVTKLPSTGERVMVVIPGLHPLFFWFEQGEGGAWTQHGNAREFDFPRYYLRESYQDTWEVDYEAHAYSTSDVTEALAMAEYCGRQLRELEAEAERLNKEALEKRAEAFRAKEGIKQSPEETTPPVRIETEIDTFLLRISGEGKQALDYLTASVIRTVAYNEGLNAASNFGSVSEY